MLDRMPDDETIGALIARVRAARGKSQYSVADALLEVSGNTSVDREYVNRWETGKRIPTPYWRRHLGVVLDIPIDALDRAAAVSRAQRAWRRDTNPLRRSHRLDAATSDTASADEWPSDAIRPPGKVDLVTIARLRAQVQQLDECYDRSPSTSLLAEVGQCLGQVAFLHSHAGAGRVRRELCVVEAEAATLMGQLVWDASQRRDHATARAYYDRAIDAAGQVRDGASEGRALLRKSFVALYGERDPEAGLVVARQTVHTAGTSHVLMGLGLLHAAEAYAMLRRKRECEQALSEAEVQFAKIDPADAAFDLFSPTQFDRLAGSCYLFLGDHRRAQAILERTARTLQDRKKSRTIVLGNLTLAHIRQNQLEQATGTLHQAIDEVEQTRGGGGLNVIFSAGRELRPWRDTSGVQEIHDRLLALMAAA
jgi:transcriptional regulator with XRE-family HTH domain